MCSTLTSGDPDAGRVARQLWSELEELPGHIRLTLARSAHTPEAVGYLADAMEHTLGEIGGDSSARHLREQACRLRAQITRATYLLLELHGVAGQLEAIAWTVQARDSARAAAREDG